MQVVLREDVEKVGKRGDIVTVADGYARNFLIPRGHAILASKGVVDQARAMRAARDRADAKLRETAQANAAKLSGVKVTIPARVGAEGKLFGSITNVEIAEATQAQTGVDIERRQVELQHPIKTSGEHKVSIKLHADVHVETTIEVVESAS